MGYLLYHDLHTDYKAVLDHARENGELVLAGGANQEQAVKTIISLVGEDTPIDVTNRIPSDYQKLHACVRPENETKSNFADRFRGFTSEYMALVGISANGEDSQLIAMVLLENSKLDENTINAMTIQLVAKAALRKKTNMEYEDIAKLSTATIRELKQKIVADKNVTDTTGIGSEGETASSSDRIKSIGEKLDVIVEALDGLVSHDSCSSDKPGAAPEIFLDDVHKALSTLKSTSVKQPTRVNESIASLTKKVNGFASMLGKRNGRPGAGGIFKPPHESNKSSLDRFKASTN